MTSEVRLRSSYQLNIRTLKIIHEKFLIVPLFDYLIVVWPLLTSEVTEVNLLLTKTFAHPWRSVMPNFKLLGQMAWICIRNIGMYRQILVAKYIFMMCYGKKVL